MEFTPHLVATSKLDNYNVVNTAGEDLGQVQDLMLNMSTGQIAYAIISFGGFLGLSDKWFAVPWEAMTWSPETKHLVLNVSKDLLRDAPGLDKRRWQEELDTKWLGESSEYFGFPATWYNRPAVSDTSPMYGAPPYTRATTPDVPIIGVEPRKPHR